MPAIISSHGLTAETDGRACCTVVDIDGVWKFVLTANLLDEITRHASVAFCV